MPKFYNIFLRNIALVLLALACNAICLQQAFAQSAPCSQARASVRPFQDCAGAQWITSAQTRISVASVTGPGCIAGELPSAANTCLQGNERRTIWLMFQIFAPDGTASQAGADAGTLSFNIIPADAATTTADDGTAMLGETDYDFALFDVTNLASRADACAAIKAATSAGTTGSRQVACNYAGLPGPTGLSLTGAGASVDGNRFCAAIPVRVGQVFVLAVDNYSLNASWFNLTFGPAARVCPATPTLLAAPSLKTGIACGYGLELAFSDPIEPDSVSRMAFVADYANAPHRPASVSCQDVDALTGRGKRFLLGFAGVIPPGTVQLSQTAAILDGYGRQYESFTRLAAIRVPARLLAPEDSASPGAPVQVQVTLGPNFRYGRWSAQGASLSTSDSSGAVFVPQRGSSFTAIYHYSSVDGCEDSASILVGVRVGMATGIAPGTTSGIATFTSHIYPNPATDEVNIETEGVKGRLDVEVLTTTGTQALRRRLADAAWTQTLSLHNLPPGAYALLLRAEGKVARHTLVVR